MDGISRIHATGTEGERISGRAYKGRDGTGPPGDMVGTHE